MPSRIDSRKYLSNRPNFRPFRPQSVKRITGRAKAGRNETNKQKHP